MPEIRPFRGLRFEPDVVGDLAAVISPPYDVISPADQQRLLARDPRNVVRLDLPPDELGDGPDDRYRRAARTFAAWRSDGSFRKDPRPSLYVYEQTYRLPGTDLERTQRGFFGRLRLEPFGPGSGVLPHERTMSGPKEDRYKLLRATGANFSPIVGLYADPTGDAATVLAAITSGQPAIDLVDDDGVHQRLWIVQGDGASGRAGDGPVERLIAAASAHPITIADGHHRYETALRYRDERRMSRSCEEDPPFDYVLTLFLEASTGQLTVLPTHRVVRGLGDDGVQSLWAGLAELFDVERASRADLEAGFGAVALAAGGRGRLGLWTRAAGAILTARRAAFEPWLPVGSPSLRRLDVTLLQVVLERLAGVDPAATAAGGRVVYTKSAAEAIGWVDRSEADADAAFLLEPTPVADISAVAEAGDVMPQKSTYFFP
ncbi:MAG TPA: DUF1015 domain-containing protein, partial [Patescibacteria group bacterium]|nr:DUF1015 domain-containing protein [Patescibacteria group bacterium]